jgi:hypothetical protein
LEHLICIDGHAEQSSKLRFEGLVFSGVFLDVVTTDDEKVVLAINSNCDIVLDGEVLMK